MKLLQAIAGGAVGGAEEFFVRLALAFARRGLDQRIAMRPNDARGGRLRAGRVGITELPFGGMLDRKTVPGLVAEMNAFRPDIGVLLNITPDHLDRRGPPPAPC